MTITSVTEGVSIVDIPEAGLSVLCACPENVVKFLIGKKIIHPIARDGRTFESGPNAILLSEVPVQGGRFSNLAEFPVLQMLYRQGMIIPGHPGNTGLRPMLIGLRDQVEAQARYIYAGNYGITSAELLDPANPEGAAALIRMKKKFAFGAFKDSSELLEVKVIDGSIVELRGGVYLRRLGVNRYEFIHGGHTVIADLNLKPGTRYASPYDLPRMRARHDAFSVIHTGEGDGWDPVRPCMSSVVVHQGRPYLVDAGPNIEESLDAAGFRVADLAGVFQTHAHDDHFVGLTSLMRSDKRLAYYAVPMVRRSATEKLRALCGVGELEFARFFDVVDLEAGLWNKLGGLEVMPVMSPHPLETTIFRFRAYDGSGPKVYAHYADLSSFAVIDSMVTGDDEAPGIPAAEASRAKAAYLEAADLKKVDVGGGMIHGDAVDFETDLSGELLFSHGCPADKVRGRGRVAEFGECSILIPADGDWVIPMASGVLRRYFPGVPDAAIAVLAGSPRQTFAAGEVLYGGQIGTQRVLLTIDGSVDRLDAAGMVVTSYNAGLLIGALGVPDGARSGESFRARTETEAIVVSTSLFSRFITENDLAHEMISVHRALLDLDVSPAFAGMHCMPCLHELARASRLVELSDGAELKSPSGNSLLVLTAGKALLFSGGTVVEELGAGDVFGEGNMFGASAYLFSSRCVGTVSVRVLPFSSVERRSAVLWYLHECFERRIAMVKASFDFYWRAEYDLGIESLDTQHHRIFAFLDRIVDASIPDAGRMLADLDGLLAEHFSFEETLQRDAGFPGLQEHAAEHTLLLGELDEVSARLRAGTNDIKLSEFMKDCFVRHTLVMDRQFLPWVQRVDSGDRAAR